MDRYTSVAYEDVLSASSWQPPAWSLERAYQCSQLLTKQICSLLVEAWNMSYPIHTQCQWIWHQLLLTQMPTTLLTPSNNTMTSLWTIRNTQKDYDKITLTGFVTTARCTSIWTGSTRRHSMIWNAMPSYHQDSQHQYMLPNYGAKFQMANNDT